MNDKEPVINFTLGDGTEIEGRRHNTMLFTFMGELACYDHIFLMLEETPEGVAGRYMWSSNESYPKLKEYMLEHNYTTYLNVQEISDEDKSSWEEHHLKDIRRDDTFPETWGG